MQGFLQKGFALCVSMHITNYAYMRKLFVLLATFVTICACEIVDKVPYVWQGEKEISPEGGTVEWTPSKKDAHANPIVMAVFLRLYDSEGEQVSIEQLDNPGQKVDGEWYSIQAGINSISISFTPNTTEYSREVQVGIEDGIPGGGVIISILQRPKDK